MTPIARLTPVARHLLRPQAQVWRAGSRRSFATRPALWARRYTEDHEWIEVEDGSKVGTIGITEYASKALGSVVYVELPEVDLEMSKGDTIGAVESVKSASDIMSPVSGKVVEVNGVLADKPAVINEGPEDKGWFAKIELADESELDSLMSKEQYDAFERDSSS